MSQHPVFQEDTQCNTVNLPHPIDLANNRRPATMPGQKRRQISILTRCCMWWPRTALLLALCLLAQGQLLAAVPVAILEFELKDLTPLPAGAAEQQRTASLKPLLEQALENQGGYELLPVDPKLVSSADAGTGYLFEHHDVAAEVGRELGAEWIVVGRLHKPSFLFAYLMVHLIEVDSGRLAGDFVVEVKGQPEVTTRRGVKRLAEKIHHAINR